MDNAAGILNALKDNLEAVKMTSRNIDDSLREVLNSRMTPEILGQMTEEDRNKWKEMQKALNSDMPLKERMDELQNQLNNFRDADISNK